MYPFRRTLSCIFFLNSGKFFADFNKCEYSAPDISLCASIDDLIAKTRPEVIMSVEKHMASTGLLFCLL